MNRLQYYSLRFIRMFDILIEMSFLLFRFVPVSNTLQQTLFIMGEAKVFLTSQRLLYSYNRRYLSTNFHLKSMNTLSRSKIVKGGNFENGIFFSNK